jgi:lipid-A-disaccharide synthase
MNRSVLLIAGETSGDAHGAGVVRELKRLQPDLELFGIGGEKMKQEGMTLTYHVRELSFMGFFEVIRHLPLLRSVEKTLMQLLKLKKPLAVVLIDYPGFNLRFAKIAKGLGIPIYYYISPQVWAWKKGRIKKMRGVVDMMAVIFPFEKKIYEREGIPVRFVGHPLIEELTVAQTRAGFCDEWGIRPEQKILALLPGSRRQEIRQLFSVMVRAAGTVAVSRDLAIAVACAPDLPAASYEEAAPPGVRMVYVRNATHALLKYSDAAIVTSGTATLEAACFNVPMVIVYKTSWITYAIGRLLVQLKNIGLANIVAGRTIVPELIQHKATVDNIAAEIASLLDDDARREMMKADLAKVKESLGGPGASVRVAEGVLELIGLAAR